jgi:aspartate carbamoyltransferase catalytic subunit
MQHILEAQQFTKRLIGELFNEAEAMERVVAGGDGQELRGKIMASLFYAVSTRTRLSFEAAMLRLGGSVISTEQPETFSSEAIGGNLEDTVRMVGNYADVIVLRHPEEGSAHRAAAVAGVPVINAGDGGGQHPTQALLDLYTIYRAFDGIEGVSVVVMGDLANSRTVRSLCYYLARYSGVKLALVSPKALAMRQDILDYLGRHNVALAQITEPGDELVEAVRNADVVYQTDLPRAAAGAPSQATVAEHRAFRVDQRLLGLMRKRAIIMHPFPRVDGISPEVDSDRRAFYWQQMRNGLYIRMALLRMVLAG